VIVEKTILEELGESHQAVSKQDVLNKTSAPLATWCLIHNAHLGKISSFCKILD
jgi:hypothetical protein